MGWNTGDGGPRRNIPGYDCTRTNDRPSTYRQTRQHDRSRPDPSQVIDADTTEQNAAGRAVDAVTNYTIMFNNCPGIYDYSSAKNGTRVHDGGREGDSPCATHNSRRYYGRWMTEERQS